MGRAQNRHLLPACPELACPRGEETHEVAAAAERVGDRRPVFHGNGSPDFVAYLRYEQRTRGVYRVPYDPALVAGSVVPYNQLSQNTRRQWLRACAGMAEGL